jgi:hypothetical protein
VLSIGVVPLELDEYGLVLVGDAVIKLVSTSGDLSD